MQSTKKDILRVIVAVLLVQQTLLSAAAQTGVSGVQPRFTETIDVSLVNVDVIVTDRNGERVRGLEAEDFTILEDGKPQTIVNFAEYAAEAEDGQVIVEGPSRARTAEAPPRQPRTFLIFVDELALVGSKSDFRASLNDVLRTALKPGDTGALLSWTNRLNVRQGYTADVAALEKAINSLPKPGPFFGPEGMFEQLRQDEAFWQSVANDPRNFGMSADLTSGLIRQSLATTAYVDMKSKVRAINAAMTAASGAQGRKVLLLVTHRFSRHAGREFFLDPRYDSRAAPPATPWLDQRRLIESVAETANATGFTIYGLHPEGLRATMDTAASSGMPAANDGVFGGRDHHVLMNETESLELVSDRTGGEYAWGRDALELLPRVAGDLTDYYSIAYRTAVRGTDNRRKITVRVKNRDYNVRARTEYVERSDNTRMKDRVTASVFAEIDKGTIPIQAQFGPQEKGRDTWPLKIRIPIAALTTAHTDGAHTGAFTVYLAWNTEAGTVSDTKRKTQPFKIKAEDLARAKESHFTYTFDVRIDNHTRALGVGVLDENSKEYGVLTVPLVNAGEPEAPPQYGAVSSVH